MDFITLNEKVTIPVVGFGVFRLNDGASSQKVMETALETGYTFFDTAARYENEELLGAAIKASGKKREAVQLATKVWPNSYGRDQTLYSVERSLKKLGTDTIDVLFLHWPAEGYVESWKALEELEEQGIAKSIAVCNFHQEHLERLFVRANSKPVMNQLETHPYLQLDALRVYLQKEGIVHESWGPLAQGKSKLLQESTLIELAQHYQKTPAQIVLRWHIQRGSAIIPKSAHAQRIRKNLELFDFRLSEEDMKRIRQMDRGEYFSLSSNDADWLEETRKGWN